MWGWVSRKFLVLAFSNRNSVHLSSQKNLEFAFSKIFGMYKRRYKTFFGVFSFHSFKNLEFAFSKIFGVYKRRYKTFFGVFSFHSAKDIVGDRYVFNKIVASKDFWLEQMGGITISVRKTSLGDLFVTL